MKPISRVLLGAVTAATLLCGGTAGTALASDWDGIAGGTVDDGRDQYGNVYQRPVHYEINRCGNHFTSNGTGTASAPGGHVNICD
ncbi:chaplin [Streptomyces coeruleoprunus]|uniref:Chaplin n=1 Tax=Streptomyces coeruleoprunus TaxID=285563 RepID=A0ABV9XFL6_9ACTN